MNSARSSHLPVGAKGRPLVMLIVILSVWVGSRMVAWESPFPIAEALEKSATQLLASQTDSAAEDQAAIPGNADWAERVASDIGVAARYDPPTLLMPNPAESPGWEDLPATGLSDDLTTSSGHQLIWMAAMAHLPVPQAIEQRIAEPVHPAKPMLALQPETDRWSLDGWVFWRDGSNRSLVSVGRAPTYGASQAGAVLNYRIAPNSRSTPRAYARIYRALLDQGETEVAIGASLRPIDRIPIRAYAELRVTEFQTSTEVRPAAFVTTEIPTLQLPLGLQAEAYGQAGYVGGEAATAFADGQLHVMRDITRFDLGKVGIGGAAWAGAQEGAERVDIGPTIRVDVSIAQTPARLSIDYRERIAGDAEPPSGVAVTLSTRF